MQKSIWEKMIGQVLQKKNRKIVMFVHTVFGKDGIVILVNPNTLYSFCYTP